MISVVVISKDEPELRATLTGVSLEAETHENGSSGGQTESTAGSAKPGDASGVEVLVVDASSGRLDSIRREFPAVRWLDFAVDDGSVTIARQRNEGIRQAKGDVIVFTDAGCTPKAGWLHALTSPILTGAEEMTAGRTLGEGPWSALYEPRTDEMPSYLDEAPTINLAFHRRVLDAAGGFDEQFEYGSDLDFTWRAVAHGIRISSVPAAVVTHDWGTRRRQLRRSFHYGKARVRLHRKHGTRLAALVRREPTTVAYPLFLLGLPLTAVFPSYLLLLVVPAWRARKSHPFITLIDHVVFGAGVLRGLLR
ncbi:MAG: glycosyltransferase [Acidimicrobiales bacterium]